MFPWQRILPSPDDCVTFCGGLFRAGFVGRSVVLLHERLAVSASRLGRILVTVIASRLQCQCYGGNGVVVTVSRCVVLMTS